VTGTCNCDTNSRFPIKYCTSAISFEIFLIVKARETRLHHLHPTIRPFKRRIQILCVPNEKADLHKTRSRIVTRVLRKSDLSFQENIKSNSNRNRSRALITSVTNETSFFFRKTRRAVHSVGRSFVRSFVRPYLPRIDLAAARRGRRASPIPRQ